MRNTRSRSRRHVLDVDLNLAPPVETREEDAIPNSDVQTAETGDSTLPQPIDVEALDDDVMISSPSAFEEATKNARRNRRRAAPSVSGVVDVDSATGPSRIKRRRTPYQTIINCETYINLEGDNNSPGKGKVVPSAPVACAPPPPPPPKEPIFNCPVCMGPFLEETSTKCGHIFCKQCIKTAIGVQPKCPTCRKKTTARDLIRVYLPVTRSV